MVEPYLLPIHFDNFQGKHEINSDTLIVFVEAYKEIAELFGLSAEIQIGVPEEGGWKTNLAILGCVISFVGINPISIILTGETSEDWAKKGRTYLIEQINEFIINEAKNIPDEFPKECIKQKNKIYEQFQKDSCVDTFHLGKFPPIPRSDFYLYIKDLQDDEYVYLGEADITVHSPDWKGKRSWKGKIDIIDETASSFAFDKDITGKFWEMVKLDSLPLHTTDVMKVQLVKRPTYKVKYLVIRVLSYNEQSVDAQLDEAEIQKITTLIQIHQKVAENINQGDLFN